MIIFWVFGIDITFESKNSKEGQSAVHSSEVNFAFSTPKARFKNINKWNIFLGD